MSAMTQDRAWSPEERGGADGGVRLAAIEHAGTQEIDELISAVARRLRDDGLRVGGTVQSNPTRSDRQRCDMELEELTTGRAFPISQQLGPESRGCRLDGTALEQVVGLVDASLRRGLDILIVNKFGKQEAEGKGLRNTIAKAVEAGIPVLVGLNRAHAAAWRQFSGGQGKLLAPDAAVIDEWLQDSLHNSLRRVAEK